MKGIKNTIDKTSFNKSTLKGFIRKGFIGIVDIDKTLLADYTKNRLAEVVKAESTKNNNIIDLFFVRDKNLCFMLDTKKQIVFNCVDCRLNQYFDYFIKQNKDWQVVDLDNIHPDNLHSRGLGIDKIASQNNFTL